MPYALWLISSPSFIQSPHTPPSDSCQFQVSMPLFVFCLSVLFFIRFHMSEIIWYFSFTNWLISLSITISRSIYTVTKGRSSFFLWVYNIPLCKCTTAFISTHLRMGSKVCFMSISSSWVVKSYMFVSLLFFFLKPYIY